MTFRAHALIALATSLLAMFTVACTCTCPAHEDHDVDQPTAGRIVIEPGAVANAALAPRSNGANPKIYGRARFQGSTVRFDLQTLESSPAQIVKLIVNWTSHNDATSPIAWPVLTPDDPLHTYNVTPPKTRWYVFDIPATWDSSGSNDCYHIKVDAYDSSGNLVIGVTQKFTPVVDSNWYQWLNGG